MDSFHHLLSSPRVFFSSMFLRAGWWDGPLFFHPSSLHSVRRARLSKEFFPKETAFRSGLSYIYSLVPIFWTTCVWFHVLDCKITLLLYRNTVVYCCGPTPYAHMGVFKRTPRLFDPRVNRCHPTRTLTRARTRTLWSDQCLDAVACEGSRLIRRTWMLCLEILNVDWKFIGPARDAVGHCCIT